jgi:hypothetical protein
MDIMKMGQAPGYLGSWDLLELPNKEVTLTIDKIVDEEVVADGRKEICTVIHWKEKDYLPMIINITNKKAIAKLYNTKDTEKLKGKAVIIGIEKVKAFGDIHDALRIRKRIPPKKTAVLPKCEQCGKDINGFGNMTPEQMASYTALKYGKPLCSECASALAQGGQE